MARREQRMRSALRAGLPVAGTLVIFGAILFVDDLVAQVAVVLLGILLIQAGVWRLAEPLLPEARSNLELRSEVDAFLELIREMDAARRRSGPDAPSGAANAPSGAEEIRDRLHERVERMYSTAGDGTPTEPDASKAMIDTGAPGD